MIFLIFYYKDTITIWLHSDYFSVCCIFFSPKPFFCSLYFCTKSWQHSPGLNINVNLLAWLLSERGRNHLDSFLLCLGVWCSHSAHQISRKLGLDVSHQKMKHSGVLVPKLAWLYSRVMLASLKFSFCFAFLYLMEGKAAMQTIIINDFVRFLFKHAFIFRPLFFSVTAAHFECDALFYCLCALQWTLICSRERRDFSRFPQLCVWGVLKNSEASIGHLETSKMFWLCVIYGTTLLTTVNLHMHAAGHYADVSQYPKHLEPWLWF